MIKNGKWLNSINNNYFLFLNFFIIIILQSFKKKSILIKYKKYISECKNFIKIKNNKTINYKNPFISICLPVYNMEKFIESSLLSIINQSFENFEIVIANDNSKDETINIIKRLQSQDKRIKIINHNKNLGVYSSRIKSILYSKGEYILLMDPDDMILNPNLFQELFNYYLKNNLDIIEFSVYYQEEKRKKIYLPSKDEFNHYHSFKKNIIYQPELSNILFYKPNSNNYSKIICRTIWNKLYKKDIFIKAINYIEKEFHNKFLVASDDTPINMIYFQFANNYSNIFIPGYLYNIRKNSISNKFTDNNHLKIICINYLLYFKLFYRYIIDFNKDLNYLYYDLKAFSIYILRLKDFKIKEYILKSKELFNNIINNKNISRDFKYFISHIYDLLLSSINY
jgi:glycosyltransferase involved in cell wall biosynthesis